VLIISIDILVVNLCRKGTGHQDDLFAKGE